MTAAEGNAEASPESPAPLWTARARSVPLPELPPAPPLGGLAAPAARPFDRSGVNATRPVTAPEPAAPAAAIDPRRVTRLLVLATVALTVGHLAALYVHHGLGYDYALGLVPLFDFNMESNAPTWFSSALLLGVGIVAAVIASRAAALRGHWLLVAGVALFLSLDESVQLHELLSALLRRGLAVGPGFSLAVAAIVGLLPVLLGAAVFYRFLRALPRSTAVGLVVAGAVYLGGAVGVDTVVAAIDFGGEGGAVSLALHTVEELLEMAGLILAIHVLLVHLQRHAGRERVGAAAAGGLAA